MFSSDRIDTSDKIQVLEERRFGSIVLDCSAVDLGQPPTPRGGQNDGGPADNGTTGNVNNEATNEVGDGVRRVGNESVGQDTPLQTV